MQIITQSVHFDADQKLLRYVERKISKMEKYFDRIIGADVMLRLENSGQVRDKIVELKIKVPGNTLVAKGTSKTFERAIDRAVDLTKRQIKRYKERLRAKT